MTSMKFVFSLLFIGILSAFSSCVQEKPGNIAKEQGKTPASSVLPPSYGFVSPVFNQTIIPGENLLIKIKCAKDSIPADSIIFLLNGVKIGKIDGSLFEYSAATKDISPGIKRLRLEAFFSNGKTEAATVTLKVLSDITPASYGYKVLGTFPHDKKSYTQGFEYHDGHFIEGTGQYHESSIQKVLPGTGDKIKIRNNSSEIFGEGITVLNGKIYQITYRSQIGFIYDSQSFELLQKFSYQNLEGWGLCNNGKEIIMSDGTNSIYFRDPDYFSVIRKIEVFDNKSEVDSLNELEYINGVIYSNRYMTNEIVMIDPENGKVIGKADMRGLLKPEDRHPNIDVLNGIAWDEAGKRLFVTGKYWPKVYSIDLVRK